MVVCRSSFDISIAPEEPLDLAHSFACGQIFRWRRVEGTWVGTLGRTALVLREVPGGIAVESVGEGIEEAALRSFLGLQDPLAAILRAIDTDATIHACLEALPGLRVLRQDPWECLITYICSAWNNIPKINRSVEQIARRWGERHELAVGNESVAVYSFPAPAALARATEEALRGCGLGYRAPYVAQTARRIAAGELDLEALRSLSYPEALARLVALPGIGRKVADCILLFSLDKSEAVPVDVWVRRLMHEYYGPAQVPGARCAVRGARPEVRVRSEAPIALAATSLANREYDAIQRFAWERWGQWAGYAQQYLFYGKRLGVI